MIFRIFFRLTIYKLKIYLKALPFALLGGAVFAVLISLCAFAVINLLSSDNQITKTTVGVITDSADNEYMDLGMNLLSSMDSTSEYFEFKIMNSKKAKKALKRGDIIAIMEMSSDTIDNILSGRDASVSVIFNDTDPLSEVLLTEITRSGAALLRGAQAGTYTTADIYYKLDLQSQLNSAFNDVDMLNFKIALSRENLYMYQDIYGNTYKSDNSSLNYTLLFYITTAILLILLTIPFILSGKICPDNNEFLIYGMQKTGFRLVYTLSSIITLSTIFTLIMTALSVCYNLLCNNVTSIELPVITMPVWFYILIPLLLSSFTTFIFFATPTVRDSVIIYFLSISLISFASGILIPIAFMPSFIKKISTMLPFKHIHTLILSAFEDSNTTITGFNLIYIIAFIIIMTILSYVVLRNRLSLSLSGSNRQGKTHALR